MNKSHRFKALTNIKKKSYIVCRLLYNFLYNLMNSLFKRIPLKMPIVIPI